MATNLEDIMKDLIPITRYIGLGGSHNVAPQNRIRVASGYIAVGAIIYQGKPEWIKLAYSPKYQVLQLTFVESNDPAQKFKLQPAKSSNDMIRYITNPVHIRKLKAPRGRYLPIEGRTDLFKFIGNSKEMK